MDIIEKILWAHYFLSLAVIMVLAITLGKNLLTQISIFIGCVIAGIILYFLLRVSTQINNQKK